MSLYMILFLIFVAVVLISYFVVPTAYSLVLDLQQKRVTNLARKLDRVMPKQQLHKVATWYLLAPVVLAVACYFFFPPETRLVGVFFGAGAGLIVPNIYTKILIQRNRQKFDDQLVDALMIMSSSFRGGLSLIQAMESVVEEMPDPINQEFSTVLGENKMGVSLEEALNHLYRRMPSPGLQQMITAILLARETGGNLPQIFSRIVSVIRERKKIESQLNTLTIQGKIQGIVLSALPVMFFFVIRGTNPNFFGSMFNSDIGRAMLIYACISETVGAFMIWKICSMKDF